MLTIIVPGTESWNEKTEEFVYGKDYELHLEHSLVSISKWESKWHKPFLERSEKTEAQIMDYIRCMCITPNVPDDVFYRLSRDNIKDINDYIEDSHTATIVTDPPSKGGARDIMTSEVIYYYMIALNIPVEFQKWHLNRLITLIRVCNKKNAPPKKRSSEEILRSHADINAMNRARFGSKG